MKTIYLYFVIFFILLSGCKKFITIPPPNDQLSSTSVFNSDATATAAISGLYSNMMTGSSGFAGSGLWSVAHLTGLSADEFTNYSVNTDDKSFYLNALQPTNQTMLSNLWGQPYNFIYTANSIIEGLDKSQGVSNTTRQQIRGEALFIRAFCYFYLVNLYGDVPLITTTSYTINSKTGRAAKSLVYDQVALDLQEAKKDLSPNYTSGIERVRPNSYAASALLARVYLYTGKYDAAEMEASTVIANTFLYELLTDINTVFLKNSREAIWQLKPVNVNSNTQEGDLYILTGIPSNVSLSTQLYNSFETGDIRKQSWTHDTIILTTPYHYAFKYKVSASPVLSEYSMVLRLAEQYLVRSEARLMQNKIVETVADLNTIRMRANLPAYGGATDKVSLAAAILHERQVELFTEWGHRWLDLKRTGMADPVLGVVTPQKGGFWNATQLLYPIPQSEIDKDINLKQNPGY